MHLAKLLNFANKREISAKIDASFEASLDEEKLEQISTKIITSLRTEPEKLLTEIFHHKGKK